MSGATADDRRKLDRDAAGCQPPAPVARPTPPEELPSRPVVLGKTLRWLQEMGMSPRESAGRAIYDAIPGTTIVQWADLEDEAKDHYLLLADAALDAVAPLLRSPTFRSIEARRNAELRHALATVAQLNDQLNAAMVEQVKSDEQITEAYTELLRVEGLLNRKRAQLGQLITIIQRKRAGANRLIAYYRRSNRQLQELLRERNQR